MTTATARLGTARQVPLAALPTAPRMGRVLVENAGAAWHIPDDVLETAKLLMSEFVTNGVFCTGRAVGSAMPAPEEHVAILHARVELHRDVIRVAVWDSDPSAPVVQTPTDDSESGRGLVLVTALARNWGFYFPPAGGKVVWADIALSDSEDMASPDPAKHWWPLPKRPPHRAGRSSTTSRSEDGGVAKLEQALWQLQ